MLNLVIISTLVGLLAPLFFAFFPIIKDAGSSWPEENPEHIIGRRQYSLREWDQTPAQIEVVETHEPMVREHNNETLCLCQECYMSHMKMVKRPSPPPIPISSKPRRAQQVLMTYLGVTITNQDVDNFFKPVGAFT